MYSQSTSRSTQPGERPVTARSGDVSSTRQHSIMEHATEVTEGEVEIHKQTTRYQAAQTVQQTVCAQLPTSADNVTLLAVVAERQPCSNRSLSPGRRAHSSKPAAAACGRRMRGRTDRLTDARQLHRPCSAYYASSVNKATVDIRNAKYTHTPK